MWLGGKDGVAAIFKTNRVRLYQRHAEFQECTQVIIFPRLQSCGRRTYMCSFEVFDDSEPRKLLAQVETTIIATNKEHTKSVEIPNREAICEYIKNQPEQKSGLGRTSFAPPPENSEEVFVYKFQVRAIDCDSLGHVNNTMYGNLAEEARDFAATHGGYGKFNHLAKKEAMECMISYDGQAVPRDEITVKTWAQQLADNSEKVEFRFDFLVREKVVTRSSLLVETQRQEKVSKL
eukprot:CAMPEP_0184017164 /NCGR_PEP_ID=MMETSP0954-20121128/7359_1 /TAXON_ID=627963 /ORGANISM="Aplanochytrium sp, Strain PBS07" /LENGTH=233 /DNA_ID=CAMNT_0026298319 /DNA_START=86 /DNA_END=787 /DNA_ORIENTATION=-